MIERMRVWAEESRRIPVRGREGGIRFQGEECGGRATERCGVRMVFFLLKTHSDARRVCRAKPHETQRGCPAGPDIRTAAALGQRLPGQYSISYQRTSARYHEAGAATAPTGSKRASLDFGGFQPIRTANAVQKFALK